MNVVLTGRAAWREYADLVQAWGIDEANAQGFTVRHGDVVSSVHIPGGLTEEHYDYFAPFLSEEDRAELARGVLLNVARMALGSDNTLLQDHVLRDFSPGLLDSLPALIEAQKFDGVARLVKENVAAYRKATAKRTPAERTCMFQRFQVSNSYFWRVRFVWEGNVEEAIVEETVGMVYLRLLLQSRSPATIDSEKLEATAFPRPQHKPQEDGTGDGPQGQARSATYETRPSPDLTAGQMDRLIELQQAKIDRLVEKQRTMIDCPSECEAEQRKLMEELAQLKKMRRTAFGLRGRLRLDTELGNRQASDRIYRNLITTYAGLREKGLMRLAAFFRKHIKRQDFGFRYLPPDPPIDWQF